VADKAIKMLTLDEILAADDLLVETIEIPEWGGSVKLRGLTAAEKSSLSRKARADGGPKNVVTIDTEKAQFAVIQMGMVEPRIGVEMYEQLMKRSAAAIDRIYERIAQLSGMDVTGAEEGSSKGISFQVI